MSPVRLLEFIYKQTLVKPSLRRRFGHPVRPPATPGSTNLAHAFLPAHRRHPPSPRRAPSLPRALQQRPPRHIHHAPSSAHLPQCVPQDYRRLTYQASQIGYADLAAPDPARLMSGLAHLPRPSSAPYGGQYLAIVITMTSGSTANQTRRAAKG
jgi:hypothetical protein